MMCRSLIHNFQFKSTHGYSVTHLDEIKEKIGFSDRVCTGGFHLCL